MSESSDLRSGLLRPLILVATALLTWIALLIGQQFSAPDIEVGDRSPEEFVAQNNFTVDDDAQTQIDREAAAGAVPPVYRVNTDVDEAVVVDIDRAFTDARQATLVPGAEPLPPVTTTTLAVEEPADETTTTTEAPAIDQGEGENSTTTTEPPTTTTQPIVRSASVTGSIYLDRDGDALLSPDDFGLPSVTLVAYDSTGEERTAVTGLDGSYTIIGLAAGPVTVVVDTATVPERLALLGDLNPQEALRWDFDLVDDEVEILDALPLTPLIASLDRQVQRLADQQRLPSATNETLAMVATEDVIREMLGEPLWIDDLQVEAQRIALDRLREGEGILEAELQDAKLEVQSVRGVLTLLGADIEVERAAAIAVSEIAAEFLRANRTLDAEALAAQQNIARESTPVATIVYSSGDLIVRENQIIDEIDLLALRAAGLLRAGADQRLSLLAVSALLVATLYFYLARFRPIVWGQMRRLILFGLLIVLAAASARGVAVFAAEDPSIGFLMPAAAFGLMAAILFDARIAVLTAMAVGGVTAIATLDPGYTLFALLATLAPVPFVSSISARGELRRAVAFMTIALAITAAAISWFFLGGEDVATAAAFGAINGVLSGLVGTAALSFLEIIFDVTTSLRLLDLTDRNHPALRLLEEKALGTFNHALMVGTLADRGARAVDANNLLARAAAYYHDLGKTEHPQFFIENQFGIQNPHDRLPPEESANVIRQHVIDGVRLARRFRIPADVADGVVCHHGDAVMRYFYNKAVDRYGEENVDIEDYRHAGRKPKSKEMAIVMMADSVEGACRAVFQEEEPSEKRITEVVEQVVGEKMSDGQLSASTLTLGDLTKVKAAMVDALTGHYHQRIPYPNFPDTPASRDQNGEGEPSDPDDPEGESRAPSSASDRPGE